MAKIINSSSINRTFTEADIQAIRNRQHPNYYAINRTFEISPSSLVELQALLQQLIDQLQGNNRRSKPVANGTWGGDQIGMNVTDNGASLDFGCASGSIDEPLRADVIGNFSVQGTLTQRMGVMPADPELLPKPQSVTYNGQIRGNAMDLHITLNEDGSHLGDFTLRLGQEPTIFYCY